MLVSIALFLPAVLNLAVVFCNVYVDLSWFVQFSQASCSSFGLFPINGVFSNFHKLTFSKCLNLHFGEPVRSNLGNGFPLLEALK